MSNLIPVQVIEFLVAGSDSRLFSEKIAAAKQKDQKSVLVESIAERAYLGNAAWLRHDTASGYVKGWCATLRTNEGAWLALTLREQVGLTRLGARCDSALAQRTENFPGSSPIEIARKLVESASPFERNELSTLTGLADCHSEILAHMLLAPFVRE
jgi:hypothetical protein